MNDPRLAIDLKTVYPVTRPGKVSVQGVLYDLRNTDKGGKGFLLSREWPITEDPRLLARYAVEVMQELSDGIEKEYAA